MSNYFLGSAIVIVIIIVGFSIYFYYEKPVVEDEKEYVDLNIFAKDINGNLIETDYEIYVDNNLYGEGKTSNKAGVLHKVPLNKSINIYNVDSDDYNYYFINYNLTTENKKPYRINLPLEKPGNISFNIDGEFGYDKSLNVTLKSSGVNKNLNICFKWSNHIIYLQTDLEKIINEDKIKGFDKCYNLKDLSGESNFIIDYETFNTIGEEDNIFFQINGYNVEYKSSDKVLNYQANFTIK